MNRARVLTAIGSTFAFVAGALAACVGDSGNTVIANQDGSSPDASAQGTNDGSSVPNDAGVTTDSGGSPTDAGNDAGTSCRDGGYKVYGPGPASLGVFCGPGANPDGSAPNTNGRYCARGDHCCIGGGAATTCASACPGSGGDFACGGSADCDQTGGVDGGPMQCCAENTAVVDTATCSYAIFDTLHHGICQASCGTQRQVCLTDQECAPLHCVGTQNPYLPYGISICQ
jgi:hypothetical protein